MEESYPGESSLISDCCKGWTNEKHHTFLDCLEASFVEQLHRSIVLRAACVEQSRTCRNLSQKLSASNDKASKQFTASQDGCGKKINAESNQPIALVRHGKKYHHFMHLQLCSSLYSEERQRRDTRTLSHELEERSNLLLPIRAEFQESDAKIAEGSGQNFVDEDTDENRSSKKLKTAMMDTADNEQIVPTGKFESSGVANSMFQREINLECYYKSTTSTYVPKMI